MTNYARIALALVSLYADPFYLGTAGVATGIAGVPPASSAPHVWRSTPAKQAPQTTATSANNRIQTIQFESKLVRHETLPYNVLLPG